LCFCAYDGVLGGKTEVERIEVEKEGTGKEAVFVCFFANVCARLSVCVC